MNYKTDWIVQSRCLMDKIIGWKLVITWEDDTDEDVVDIPDWCASQVDTFLNELEEEVAK